MLKWITFRKKKVKQKSNRHIHSDLSLSFTCLKENKNSTVSNFYHLEQQSGSLKVSNQWQVGRWENRQASTNIPLILLVAEQTSSLFPMFSLQLSSAHGSSNIWFCQSFWHTLMSKHSAKVLGMDWEQAMSMLTQVTSLWTVNQWWVKKTRDFQKLIKCHDKS